MKAKLIEQILQVNAVTLLTHAEEYKNNPINKFHHAKNRMVSQGDLFFALAFRTEAELIKIAKELNIKVE